MSALYKLAQKNKLEKRINRFKKNVNAVKYDHLKKHILSYEPMIMELLVSNKHKIAE